MEVYVVTAVIQHLYDTEKYFEVLGVALSKEGASELTVEAMKRREVQYTEHEVHTVGD